MTKKEEHQEVEQIEVEQPIEAAIVHVIEDDTHPIALGAHALETPEQVLHTASQIAKPLKKAVTDLKLFSQIGRGVHVHVEGWNIMLGMMGIASQERTDLGGWRINEHNDHVYEAYVELFRVRDGRVVGGASAECGSSDEVDRNGKPVWSERSRSTIRSMAITRATGKAARMNYSWIMKLAGYEATPAEELQFNGANETAPQQPVSSEPRQVNQWEDNVITTIVELKLVQARPHAVNRLNASPFFEQPYGSLDLVEAVAYMLIWNQCKDDDPSKLDVVARAAQVDAVFVSSTREAFISRATDLIASLKE